MILENIEIMTASNSGFGTCEEDLDEDYGVTGGNSLRKQKTTRIAGADFPMRWCVPAS